MGREINSDTRYTGCMAEGMYVCMYVCMYVRTYICMYVRTYIRTYVCMYVTTCMYICTLFIKFVVSSNMVIFRANLFI